MATITTSQQKNSTNRRQQGAQLPRGRQILEIRASLQSHLDSRPEPEQPPRLMGIMMADGTMKQRDVGITPTIPLYHQHSLVYFVGYVGGEPLDVGFAELYECGDMLTPLSLVELTRKYPEHLLELVEAIQR